VRVQAKTVFVFVTELRRNDFEEFRVIDISDTVELQPSVESRLSAVPQQD
jgi:hypothetical protein